MAKGPKGFSDIKREELREELCVVCEQNWALYGYKKTNIAELTAKIGISTGAFYLLYKSKEELFCKTLERVQNRLKQGIQDIIYCYEGKEGFKKSMKWQFQEYNKAPFLYGFENSDFMAFLNKLPKESVEKLKFDNVSFFSDTIKQCNLTLKINREKAYAIINTLLYTVTIKDKVNYDHLKIFDFLLDSVVDRLFK